MQSLVQTSSAFTGLVICFELVDLVEEGLPGGHVVVAPALALVHVAAEDVDLLQDRGGAELRPDIGGERRELLEHRFHRGARVVVGEFEAHRPAAQVLVEEGLLVGVVEVGGAHHEGVGKERRALHAEPVFEVEARCRSIRRAGLPS